MTGASNTTEPDAKLLALWGEWLAAAAAWIACTAESEADQSRRYGAAD
ncbi:MAG: hypothetical protein ACLQF1_09495 [Methyloceanibacter sp.]|jgi:hypothetical protein